LSSNIKPVSRTCSCFKQIFHLFFKEIVLDALPVPSREFHALQTVGRVEEVEVWQDLASVYTELKQWRDAETCLEKAQALKTYSTVTWCATGEELKLF
jgi:hypothetical protein